MTESALAWKQELPSLIPRLLITGGSGFIGTNAVQFALQAGIETRSVDIQAPKCPAHAAVWQQCDLLDAPGLRRAIHEFAPSHILHLAARTDLLETRDLDGYAANMKGVASLIEALRGTGCRRTIFTSSMLVCRNGYRPSADEEYCPDTLYGESKVRGEKLVRQVAAGYRWSIVRPTSIWGPWFGSPYRQFFQTVARGLYVNPGAGKVEKALGFVGNTIWQLFRILTAPQVAADARTFYLADYDGVTTREWAGLIAREFGSSTVRDVPLPIMRAAAVIGDLAQALGVKNPPLTSFRLRNMLTPSGFDLGAVREISGALPFTVEQGVKETVAWMSTASRPARRIPALDPSFPGKTTCEF